MQRHCLSLLFISLFAALLTGCKVTHRHNHAYLLYTPAILKDKHLETTATNGIPEYKVSLESAVEVPKNSYFDVDIDAIRLGFLHTRTAIPQIGNQEAFPYLKIYEKKPTDGLGGKQIWIIADSVSLNKLDPLGQREKHIVSATTVKLDQESFGFVPLDSNERLLLRELADTSYRVRIRVYLVRDFQLKQTLTKYTSKSIAKLTQEGISLLIDETKSLFLNGFGLVEALQDTLQEPLFAERILLEAGAQQQFESSFDVLALDHPTRTNALYALYDVSRSDVDPAMNGLFPSKSNSVAKLRNDYREILPTLGQNKAETNGGTPKEMANKPPQPRPGKGSAAKQFNESLTTEPAGSDEYVAAYLFVHSGEGNGTIAIPSKDKLEDMLSQKPCDYKEVVKSLYQTYITFHIDTHDGPEGPKISEIQISTASGKR